MLLGDFSPLWVAAHYGHLDIVKLLVSRGANPNVAVRGGLPWTEAYYRNHTDLVSYFLDRPNKKKEKVAMETENVAELSTEIEKVEGTTGIARWSVSSTTMIAWVFCLLLTLAFDVSRFRELLAGERRQNQRHQTEEGERK